MLRFMPLQLWEKWMTDKTLKEQLKNTFGKFFPKSEDVTVEQHVNHLRGKYIEVYERDDMCGTHSFMVHQFR